MAAASFGWPGGPRGVGLGAGRVGDRDGAAEGDGVRAPYFAASTACSGASHSGLSPPNFGRRAGPVRLGFGEREHRREVAEGAVGGVGGRAPLAEFGVGEEGVGGGRNLGAALALDEHAGLAERDAHVIAAAFPRASGKGEKRTP